MSYTNLGSGTYDFQVRATNSDGVWGGAGRSLQLVISPPPWKTWWAYSIYGILIALVIWGWRRFELQKEREKAFLAQVQLKAEAAEAKAKALNTEKELEKYQLRNRISADLHDEIGSNLSSISLLSAMAAGRDDIKSDVKEMLSDVNQAARHSSEAIRDIVWFINPASDKLSDLISRMRTNAKTLIPDAEVQFKINGDDLVDRLNPELKRNVYLIGKELLNNISKHARAKKVNVRLEVSDHSMTMEITDDGVGFEPHETVGGHGLNNMAARAQRLNGEFKIISAVGKGTKSTLHVKIT